MHHGQNNTHTPPMTPSWSRGAHLSLPVNPREQTSIDHLATCGPRDHRTNWTMDRLRHWTLPTLSASCPGHYQPWPKQYAPTSNDTLLKWGAQSWLMCLPTAVEPVKETSLTSGCFTRASPARGPEPNTMFTTPAGRPASCRTCGGENWISVSNIYLDIEQIHVQSIW